MLTVSGVHTFYGQIEALKGIDLDVQQGEIVTLIGANGAGKSTLLMTICGTPRARRGDIHFEGRDITKMPTYEIMRLGIAQSPEGRRIFPRMTVHGKPADGGADGRPGAVRRGRREGLRPVSDPASSGRTSAAGRFRAASSRCWRSAARSMSRPRLLLLDEPSLGLAPLIVKQIFQVIRDINSSRGSRSSWSSRMPSMRCAWRIAAT